MVPFPRGNSCPSLAMMTSKSGLALGPKTIGAPVSIRIGVGATVDGEGGVDVEIDGVSDGDTEEVKDGAADCSEGNV